MSARRFHRRQPAAVTAGGAGRLTAGRQALPGRLRRRPEGGHALPRRVSPPLGRAGVAGDQGNRSTSRAMGHGAPETALAPGLVQTVRVPALVPGPAANRRRASETIVAMLF